MPAADAEPLSNAEAAQLFAPLAAQPGLVVAVSGGPDSVVLMGLLAQWAEARGQKLWAVSVDHGLRPESAQEAAQVADLARQMGVAHQILYWQGEKPKTGLQAAARAARYALIFAFARQVGASAVVTAHHGDDQAETVLYRLLRGSGPAGLVGMAAQVQRGGLMLFRPFLGVPKARLLASAEARGWPYSIDPSNSNSAYLRARLRQLWPILEREGLSSARLGMLAQRLAKSEQALESAVDQLWYSGTRQAGAYVLDASAYRAAPRAIQERLMVRALNESGTYGEGGAHLRLERVEALCAALAVALEQGLALSRTLAGFVIRTDGRSQITIMPAPPRRKPG